jgi:hypothetical protein
LILLVIVRDQGLTKVIFILGDDLKPKWTHYRREYLRDKPTGSAATDGDDDEKETKFGEALSFLRERVVHRR